MEFKELIEYLTKTHPYPADIFIEPTKEQWKEFHKILKDAGFESGGFIGHACRIGYDACLYQLEKIKEE